MTAPATNPPFARRLSARPELRIVAAWLLVLVAGLVLLYLRYDWSVAGGHYAERAFLLSAYLFVLLLPTTFYLARWLLADTRAAFVLTGLLFVATTLPWDLLGLDSLAYYADRPRFLIYLDVPPARALATQFLPGGLLYSFPYDYLFMPLLFAAGAGVIWGAYAIRARAGRVAPRAIPILLTAAFALICAQSYLHTSMRAPATYHAVFTQKESKQHWYHVFHFRDGTGAVEADQFVFSALEEYFQGAEDFQGAERDPNNMMVRRPMAFYLVAQASYFINTFYVWLGLNCLFWLAAVFATGRWVSRVTTPRAGLFAAALVTVGPGFVAWVGTTAMYLPAFAVVMIGLCLFEELVVPSRGRRLASLVLFAASLAICMLVYDMLPLVVSLFVYGLARRVRAVALAATLAAACAVSYAFPYLLTIVLDTPIVDTNSGQLSIGLHEVKDLILHPTLNEWYSTTTTLLPAYLSKLLMAFFVLPLILAIAGFRLLTDRALRLLVASLLVTGFAVMAVLLIGEQIVGTVPRLVYPVYPAVYLLAGLALASIRLPGRWRNVVPWAFIALMGVLANVDIFGYPTLYVEWFHGSPPPWVP